MAWDRGPGLHAGQLREGVQLPCMLWALGSRSQPWPVVAILRPPGELLWLL